MQTEYIDIITIDELCELLMIGRTTAYKLLRSGEVKAFKIGKVWKISRAALERYIKQRSSLWQAAPLIYRILVSHSTPC